jgi:hypothetical protein
MKIWIATNQLHFIGDGLLALEIRTKLSIASYCDGKGNQFEPMTVIRITISESLLLVGWSYSLIPNFVNR